VKRTERGPPPSEKIDYSPLIRSIQYLDEVLKRGVVIGVYEDSMEVSDEDVKRALVNVTAHLDNCKVAIDQTLRSVARVSHIPGTAILQ
jgi:hypothetical protein